MTDGGWASGRVGGKNVAGEDGVRQTPKVIAKTRIAKNAVGRKPLRICV